MPKFDLSARKIVWSMIGLIVIAGLFPPWVSTLGTNGGIERSLGFRWLIGSSDEIAKVDFASLVIEWTLIVVVSLGLLIAPMSLDEIATWRKKSQSLLWTKIVVPWAAAILLLSAQIWWQGGFSTVKERLRRANHTSYTQAIPSSPASPPMTTGERLYQEWKAATSPQEDKSAQGGVGWEGTILQFMEDSVGIAIIVILIQAIVYGKRYYEKHRSPRD